MPNTKDLFQYLRPEQAVEALGDQDAARDLLAMVADTLETDIPNVATHLLSDLPRAHGVLHTLKGFLPVVCDAELAIQVAQVEKLSAAGDGAAALAHWPPVAQGLQQLGAEIHRWLSIQTKRDVPALPPTFVAPAGVVELGVTEPMPLDHAFERQHVYLRLDQARRALGDDATVFDMLELLVQTLDADLGRVVEALDQNDVATAQGILHPIKGFLPVFCSVELCDLVATVEYLSKDSTAPEVRAAFETVRPQLLELRAEAAAELKAHAITGDTHALVAPDLDLVQGTSPSGFETHELSRLPSDFGLSAFGQQSSAPPVPLERPSYKHLMVERADRLLGDRQAVLDIAAILATTLIDDLGRVRQALSQGDVAQASRLLHPLKSSVAVFCDEATADAIATVEFLSTQCTAQEVLTAFDAVEPNLRAMALELDDFLAART